MDKKSKKIADIANFRHNEQGKSVGYGNRTTAPKIVWLVGMLPIHANRGKDENEPRKNPLSVKSVCRHRSHVEKSRIAPQKKRDLLQHGKTEICPSKNACSSVGKITYPYVLQEVTMILMRPMHVEALHEDASLC